MEEGQSPTFENAVASAYWSSLVAFLWKSDTLVIIKRKEIATVLYTRELNKWMLCLFIIFVKLGNPLF